MREIWIFLLIMPASVLSLDTFPLYSDTNRKGKSIPNSAALILTKSMEVRTLLSVNDIATQHQDLLRLRGGKKGTASQGKRGTGHKAHPSYKYNLRKVLFT